MIRGAADKSAFVNLSVLRQGRQLKIDLPLPPYVSPAPAVSPAKVIDPEGGTAVRMCPSSSRAATPASSSTATTTSTSSSWSGLASSVFRGLRQLLGAARVGIGYWPRFALVPKPSHLARHTPPSPAPPPPPALTAYSRDEHRRRHARLRAERRCL